MKTIRVSLRGIAPLLMHNGQLADPLNEFVKAMSSTRGKRKKVDADHEELARLEYLGSLYLDDDNEPCIPGHIIEAVAINGAKKSKEGPLAKAGLFIEESPKVEYDGPKDPESLYKDKRFVHRSMVRVQMNKTPRVRPIFQDWAITFTATVDDDVAALSTVRNWFEAAGRVVGIGDWRPRHGRFEVERFEEIS